MTFHLAADDLGNNESMLRSWGKRSELDGPDAFWGHGARTEIKTHLAAFNGRTAYSDKNRIVLQIDGFLCKGAQILPVAVREHEGAEDKSRNLG